MNRIFSPFFLHYPVDPKVQSVINERVHNYRDNLISTTGAPLQPPGWGCNVETSFKYGGSLDDQDDMGLKETFHPYIRHASNSIGIPRVPYSFISWYNAYTGDQFQEKHDHIGSYISGVYFVQYDPEVHARFSFVNPLDQLLSAAYPELVNSPTPVPSLFDAEYSPDVKQGDLIIFPSFMVHKVNQSHEDYTNPRITFSFNIKLRN